VAQAQYPEQLHKVLLVNAPYSFETAWHLIHLLLDEKMAGKIHFCHANDITRGIAPVVLCVDYGGTHEEYPIPSMSLNEELNVSLNNDPIRNEK
jgi:hypothetical protein